MKKNFDRKRIKEHFGQAAGYYRKLYEDISPLSHLFSTRLKRVDELLGDINKLDILDVGCGPGVAANTLFKKGSRHFGIDISQEMIYEFQKWLGAAETPLLCVGIIENLPFQNASFDRVLCLGVFEYVENIELALSEISRVMKNHAIAIISMQNMFSPYRFWEHHIYSGPLLNSIRKVLRRPALNQPLEHLHSLTALKTAILHHSLMVKDVCYYNFNLWVKPLDKIFPTQSVRMSNSLEFLSRNKLGEVAADFMIKVQKFG